MKRFDLTVAWRFVLLGTGVGVTWAVGCSSSHTGGVISADCTLNTDCNSPLVCAFQRCHNACTTSRDCAPGQRCMASDRPFHVCQLDVEKRCKAKSDCPIGQVCGVDNECRDECTSASDCVNGQVCTSATCADPKELTANGTLPNAAADASTAVEGQSCRFNSDCSRPLICRSGACSPECVTTEDCPPGLACTDSRCSVPVTCSFSDGGTDRRAGGPCLYTSQCPAPLSCIQGYCTCECLGTADCEHGFACVNNRCESILGGATSAEIGPAGGSIASADGFLVMTLPRDAVDHPVVLSVRKASAWPSGAIGTVFEVEPSGTQFKKEVTIQLSYAGVSLGSLKASDLSVATAEGPKWTPLGTNVNDAAKKTISSTTPHLSVFGLFAFGSVAGDADASVTAGGGRGGSGGGSAGGSTAGAGNLGAGGIDGVGGSQSGGGFASSGGSQSGGGVGNSGGAKGGGGVGNSGGSLAGGFGGVVAAGGRAIGGSAGLAAGGLASKDAGALDCTNGCACMNVNDCGGNICCYVAAAKASMCISPLVGCSGLKL